VTRGQADPSRGRDVAGLPVAAWRVNPGGRADTARQGLVDPGGSATKTEDSEAGMVFPGAGSSMQLQDGGLLRRASSSMQSGSTGGRDRDNSGRDRDRAIRSGAETSASGARRSDLGRDQQQQESTGEQRGRGQNGNRRRPGRAGGGGGW
jgi:hypothetical protein